MSLETILRENQDAVLNSWHRAVLESYHPDTRRFLKKQKDQFANPVGHTLVTELERLIQWLIDPSEADQPHASLDRVFRIRAVQGLGPSHSLAFLFELKKIVRDLAGDAIQEDGLASEVEALDARIDQMVLLAFDAFMGCRETLYELKATQMKNQVSAVLRRAGLTSEIPSWNSTLEGGSGNDTGETKI